MEYSKEGRELLERLYWDEQKSLRMISRDLKIPLRSLAEMFIAYRIKTRTKKQGKKLAWKQIKQQRKLMEEKQNEHTTN